MSFMAVAYVPAFLEDRATFVKERANGLYGPASFIIANFFIGLPYLCWSLHLSIISSLIHLPCIKDMTILTLCITLSPHLRPLFHRHLLAL